MSIRVRPLSAMWLRCAEVDRGGAFVSVMKSLFQASQELALCHQPLSCMQQELYTRKLMW